MLVLGGKSLNSSKVNYYWPKLLAVPLKKSLASINAYEEADGHSRWTTQ